MNKFIYIKNKISGMIKKKKRKIKKQNKTQEVIPSLVFIQDFSV